MCGCFWANILVVYEIPHPYPLNTHFGTLAGGLGCFPFDYPTYLVQSDSRKYLHGIRSLITFGRLWRPLEYSVLYLRKTNSEANPKAISRRTSYLPVRLEFLPYPQVIRGRFNERRFSPPVDCTPPSTCSWIDRRVSGLWNDTIALFRRAFATAPPLRLNLASNHNSPVHSSIGTLSPFNGL